MNFFHSDEVKNECKISVSNLTGEELKIEFECDEIAKGSSDVLFFGEILNPYESSIYYYTYNKNINVDKIRVTVTNRTYDIWGRYSNDDIIQRYNGYNYMNFSENEFNKIQILITYAPSTINITGHPETHYSIGNSSLNPMDVFIIKMNEDTYEPRYIKEI